MFIIEVDGKSYRAQSPEHIAAVHRSVRRKETEASVDKWFWLIYVIPVVWAAVNVWEVFNP